MRDNEIDKVLSQAAGATTEVAPALLERISKSIGSSLRPVRPLPPSWVLVGALMAVCAGVATLGATLLGLGGIQKMDAVDVVLIFPTLIILAWLGALLSVREMIPGSRRRLASWVLPAAGSLILIAVFALLFRDYRMEHFISHGIPCLQAGLLHAIPAALLGWWILHRGFAVNSLAAGLAQGSLAGLAGIGMLELHCQNFEVPHLMLWHTAVLPLSGAIGALLVWIIRRGARSHSE